MKVSFPHMGNAYIPMKVILEDLGAQVIVPPKCSKKTLVEGIKLSPEHMCLPFKINMGNYIESIEQGAEIFFMIGACRGICRLGMFHYVQQGIFNHMGHNIQIIPIKPFQNIGQIKEFINKLREVTTTKSYLKLVVTVIRGLRILFKVDQLDDLFKISRPRAFHIEEVNQLYMQMEKDILKVKGYKKTNKILKDTRKKLLEIDLDYKKQVLRIGIVGEIYTMCEPFANLSIEKRLGEMDVEVNKIFNISEFVKKRIDFLPFIKSHNKRIFKAAKPYLPREIGGHTFQTIGTAAIYGDWGYDGIIHILPFGCMPEITAKGIIKKIEVEKDIPVLTLIFDEMTGEAGYMTRIEAFVDLLNRRKVRMSDDEGLSWS